MTLSVTRTFGTQSRYRYLLHQDGVFTRKVLSDSEARFAVVYPDLTMKLRRDSSGISKAELEDPDTQIITIQVK